MTTLFARPKGRLLFLLVATLLGCHGVIAGGDGESNGGSPAATPGNGAPGTSTTPAGAPMPSGGTAAPTLMRPAGLDCRTPTVGVAPLQRLTRSQYVHAVRDLVGGDLAGLEEMIPEDGKAGAFRSNTTAVEALDVDHFGEAAQAISAGLSKPDALIACDVVAKGNTACASQFIAAFGLRAHRRPLDTLEQSEYEALFASNAVAGKPTAYADGLRAVVQAMLQSPNFLYHVEIGNSPVIPAAAATLTPFELAARLSFLLWDTIPDPTLLDAARKGTLATPTDLRAQAMRMLADPKAADAVSAFHVQWLGIDRIDSLQKDAARFPAFSAEAAREMKEEVRRFTSSVVLTGDGQLTTLLTAPFGFPGPALKPIYGATAGAEFAGGRTVPTGATALDPDRRGGLLTHVGFLAAHAHADQTSPVSRGKAVRDTLLCDPPPPPPPALNTDAPDPAPGLTTRERFALHQKEPACAGCHALMDPIGLGFEAFDAIGGHRSTEEGHPIDARGNLVGTDVDGGFDGVVELTKKLSGSNQVRTCVARQWFRFAFGREGTGEDACSFWAGVDAFGKAQFDIRALLLAYVASDAFRLRRGS